MQGRNVSFITLPIQSMHSQYNISCLALSIRYDIQWTVNTKSHGLDCQCDHYIANTIKSHGLDCQCKVEMFIYYKCIVTTIAHGM